MKMVRTIILEETTNGKTTYKDEDGLKLELTVNSSNSAEKYTIKDEKITN